MRTTSPLGGPAAHRAIDRQAAKPTAPAQLSDPAKDAATAPVDATKNAGSTQVVAPVNQPDQLRPGSANDARNKSRIDPLHISAGTDDGRVPK